MCPAQSNLLINYFLQLFRRFFLRSVWLGPGIRVEILTVPGHTHARTPCVLRHEQLSQQSEERENSEETRRTQCGRGFAERKKTEGERQGKRKVGGKRKRGVSCVCINSVWIEIFILRWEANKWTNAIRGRAITVSDRNSAPQHTLTMQQDPNSMAPSLHYEPDLELRTVSMFSSH